MSLLSSMLTAAVGPVVNGLTDVLGMSGQAHYQRVNQRASAELQHEENKYWAEYNTPANQMARLKAAGLNPNLVYGNGADAQFVGSVSPSGSMPHMKGGYGTDFITHLNMLEQTKNLKAQNELLQSQAIKEKQIAENYSLQNEELRGRNPSEYGALQYNLNYQEWLNKQEYHKVLETEASLNEARYDLTRTEWDIENKYGYQKAEQFVKGLDLENAIKNVNLEWLPKLNLQQYNLTAKEMEKIVADMSMAYALSTLYKQETQTEKFKTRNESLRGRQINADIFKTEAEKVGQRLKNKLTQYQVDATTTDWSLFFDTIFGPILGNIGKVFGASYRIE